MKEGIPKIICDVCRGWHPTEVHAQYEKEAREKRIEEIKVRSDSDYRFDTLGFKPEKKEEIEPWMHEVIERAKDLGDDLQDADFYIHFGPLEARRTTPIPSALSMITQNSFQEAPGRIKDPKSGFFVTEGRTYMSHHGSGESMLGKSRWIGRAPIEILALQERWVKTRDEENLEKYQQAIKDEINKRIEMYQRQISDQAHFAPGPEVKEEFQKRIEKAHMLVDALGSVEGRKAAMYFIQTTEVGPTRGAELVGVIFSVGDSLFSDKSFYFTRQGSGRIQSRDSYLISTPESFIYKGKTVTRFSPHFANEFIDELDQTISGSDTQEAREFYRKFIHALYIPHGSVEEQRKVLKYVLEMTKDNPGRRLPIYNFYGKLVWPKPAGNKKE